MHLQFHTTSGRQSSRSTSLTEQLFFALKDRNRWLLLLIKKPNKTNKPQRTFIAIKIYNQLRADKSVYFILRGARWVADLRLLCFVDWRSMFVYQTPVSISTYEWILQLLEKRATNNCLQSRNQHMGRKSKFRKIRAKHHLLFLCCSRAFVFQSCAAIRDSPGFWCSFSGLRAECDSAPHPCKTLRSTCVSLTSE